VIRRTDGHTITKKLFDFAFKRLRNQRMNDVTNEPGQSYPTQISSGRKCWT